MGAEGEGGETKEKEKKKKAVTGAEVLGMPEGATTTGAGQQGSWRFSEDAREARGTKYARESRAPRDSCGTLVKQGYPDHLGKVKEPEKLDQLEHSW